MPKLKLKNTLSYKEKLSRIFFITLSVLGLINLIVYASFVYFDLWINTSESIPIGIYRGEATLESTRIPSDTRVGDNTTDTIKVNKGDIVLVCLPDSISVFALERGYIGVGSCKNKTRPVGKYVVAKENDTVELTDNFLKVNHMIIATGALSKDKHGRDLSHSKINRDLRENELYLLGQSYDSFDSRYYGVVKTSDVKAILKEVLVFNYRLIYRL